MPFDIGKARELNRPLTVHIAGAKDAIELTYRPMGYTGARAEEFRKIAMTGDSEARTYHWIETTVATWNLVNAGDAIPVSRDGIRSVPIEVLAAIRSAIEEDERGNPLWRPISENSSSPVAAAGS